MALIAEASCASQILTARAVAEDMGEVQAARKGVKSWASCHLQNSERDVQRTMKNQKTKLDIPVKTIECNGVQVPWISPESWLQWIVKKGLWPTLAGCSPNDYQGASRNRSQFWENYQKVDPDFELFRIPNTDLSRTAAFLVHGDEGRTLKRNALMVTSLQSALGCGYDEQRVPGQKADTSNLRVNFAGHSFVTRYVVNTMPKTSYESDPAIFDDAMDHVAKSLRKCFDEGCVDQVRGERFKIVVLGVKGDAPYLVKAAHFYRSYNTMAKRGDERGPPKGVCPYCLAGTNGFPAEDISTSSPCWLPTVGVKLPWLKRPAFIKHLLHNPSNPTEFFKSDIWHIVHLDFGRSWVASVVQTALPYLPCQNLEQKWEWLTDDYLRWCRTSKKQAHVSKITAYLMSYGDTTGAMGQWSKGALSTNLLQWLVDLLGKIPGDPDGLLAQCRVATYRLNSLFRLLYRSGAFLTAEQAAFISDQGLSFLRTYAAMARVMYNAGKQWLFPLYPKLHVFHHLILTVRNTASSTGLCCSPMMYGCQMDEDVVGKTSRLSRRVNIRKVSQRALDRYLVAAFTAYSKAKLLG